jgi:glycosyltransferase involved in cell wall biosynthesis
MRICLVTHGLPPYELTGVENYTLALAQGLARAGQQVEVFAARRAPDLPDLSLRRESRDGWAVTWVTTNSAPSDPSEALDPPGLAEVFERFLRRERPELVHFQHVIKLGLGLIERAKQAGIPTVYTAHDYYPICHRFTLLRPDLSRCATIGDADACARCDLALALLNRQPDLGDYQMGALPEQLSAAARAELATLLGGDEAGAGVPANELREARERRTALDQRRREVYAQLDLVLAPTQFLRERLIEGGIAAERVRPLSYGIEVSDLRGLEPRAAERAGPLQVGFLGGHSKHKGVHVLLEAWDRLARAHGPEFASQARLSIFGGSSDARYGELLRAQAAEVGAVWRGAYARADLPRILAEFDLVVVPSIWVENQPIVIREALAAGRPVLASRVGALPESVREGIDGWLFEPGDAADLARVLHDLIQDPRRVRRVARALEPVKDLAEHVRELLELYTTLRAARPLAELGALPEHLRTLALRHTELAELPTRELYAQVLSGLERLAPVLKLRAATTAEVLTAALAERSRAQEYVDDGHQERRWHETVHAADASGLRAMQERLVWRGQTLAQREAELGWLRENQTVLEQERDWLRETQAAFEKERAWLRENQAALETERTWLRGELAERERALAWREEQVGNLEREVRWRRELADACAAQIVGLSEQAAARAADETALLDASKATPDSLRRAAELLRAHDAELRAALDALLALVPARAPAPRPAPPTSGAQA